MDHYVTLSRRAANLSVALPTLSPIEQEAKSPDLLKGVVMFNVCRVYLWVWLLGFVLAPFVCDPLSDSAWMFNLACALFTGGVLAIAEAIVTLRKK